MPAYVIGQVQMRDASWREEYGPKVEKLLEKHGGRYLIRGGRAASLEGEAPLPDVWVMLEFPSMEKAQAWYNDPEYAPLIKLRQTGSDAEIVVVEGL